MKKNEDFNTGVVRGLRWSLAAMTLIGSAAAVADTHPLEEVVVTGTKLEGAFGEKSGVPLEKMPQSVQVITAQEIADLGAVSIGDLLRTVPSADPGYSRVGPWQSFSLKVRGFLADQMRNGMRQRYYEDVDASALGNIERVEVLKGPSGVLYGQSAVGGIVSIITKRPSEDFGASASASVGSFGQKSLAGDLTGGLARGLSVRVTGEIERSDTFVDHQPMDRDNFALTFRYAPNDTVTAHLVTEYVERRTKRYAGLPLLGTIQGNGAVTLDRSLDLGEPSVTDLEAFAPLFQAWVDVRLSDSWSLTPRFQYQQFNAQFGEIRVRDPQGSSRSVFDRTGRFGREDDDYYIGQLDLSGSFAAGGIGHKLLVGFEYDIERAHFTQSDLTNLGPIDALDPVYTYGATPPVAAFSYDNFYDVDSNALYVQDLLALSDRWDAIAAVRRSWIDASDGAHGGPAANRARVTSTIWQLGTTYRLSDELSAYISYNTGFDIESTAGARTRTGEPLEPEESRQLETGLRVRKGSLRGSVALFQIERVNALTADTNDPDFSINAGEQRVRGAEVEVEWQATDSLALSAGYAYLDGEITQSNDGDVGLRIGDVPQHTLNAQASYEIPSIHLTLRGGMAYTSERALVSGSAVDLPSYVLANIGIGYRMHDVSFDLTVANLFDEAYYAASGNRFVVIPGDPRTFGLRVSTQW